MERSKDHGLQAWRLESTIPYLSYALSSRPPIELGRASGSFTLRLICRLGSTSYDPLSNWCLGLARGLCDNIIIKLLSEQIWQLLCAILWLCDCVNVLYRTRRRSEEEVLLPGRTHAAETGGMDAVCGVPFSSSLLEEVNLQQTHMSQWLEGGECIGTLNDGSISPQRTFATNIDSIFYVESEAKRIVSMPPRSPGSPDKCEELTAYCSFEPHHLVASTVAEGVSPNNPPSSW